MRVHPLRLNSSADLPDVVLHMTGRRGQKTADVLPIIDALNSAQRLASILWLRQLHAVPVFGSNWPVVCFTHATRRALAGMAGRFDGVGIAFHAQSVFNAGGGPVLYVRGDEYDDVHDNPALSKVFRSRIVRWWPGATEGDPAANFMLSTSLSGVSEWTHEREWRIPRPDDVDVPWAWNFTPADVAFLLVPERSEFEMVQNQLEGFRQSPANLPSELAWLQTVPLATRTADGWTFTGGDSFGWP